MSTVVGIGFWKLDTTATMPIRTASGEHFTPYSSSRENRKSIDYFAGGKPESEA
jgi:hypothetical protein